MVPVDDLTTGVVIDPLLNPGPGTPTIIQLNAVGGTGPNCGSIGAPGTGAPGMDLMMDPGTMQPYLRYTDAPHITSSRFAEEENHRAQAEQYNPIASSVSPPRLFFPTDTTSPNRAATGNAWPRHELVDMIDSFPAIL